MRIPTWMLSALFVVLWSSGWIGSKFSLEYSGAFTFLALRYALVVFVLAAVVVCLKLWKPLSWQELKVHLVVGVLSHAVFLMAGVLAIQSGVNAGIVGFITALQPMITAAMSLPVAREAVSRQQWAGIAIGFTAVFVVIGDRVSLGESLFALCLPIAGVVALSVATLLDRRNALSNNPRSEREKPDASIVQIMLIHCGMSLLVLLPIAWLVEGWSMTWKLPLAGSLLYMAIVVSIGSYWLMLLLLRRLSTVAVSSLVYLSPPVTMFMGWLLLGESITSSDCAGLALAALAVLMASDLPVFNWVNQALFKSHRSRMADIKL